MLRNLIVLPDGTEIFSGNPRGNAVASAEYRQKINSGTELTIGSVCASCLSMKLIAGGGNLSIGAGTEFSYYKVSDNGERTKIGLFTMEKPTRSGANSYQIEAYDRVSWLDKDLTDWLSSLNGWPYSVENFAKMVCEACGLTLEAATLPNGNYQIRKFSGNGVTGRMLMQWLGQITCRFIRANADGKIEFAWYADKGEEITTRGEFAYFGGGLSYEDFTVAEIQKVQIKASENDNGTVYPDGSEEELNTYKITGNYLLTAETGDELKPVARAIFEQLQGVTYTPCKVSIQATTEINAGDIVHITDRNGVTITTYVMSKTNKGQKDTLECTGSYKRDSSTATNTLTMKALNGKVLDIKKDVDGLRVENKDTAGRVAKLELSTTEITASVESVKKTSEEALKEAQKNATDLTNYANQVSGSLTDLQNQIDGAIETWFFSYEPKTTNAPASSWTTTEDKNKHLGDLFYIVDNADKGGLVYRWALVNGVYGWVLVEDTEVAKALETASQAKDTADGKRRVFVAQPKPPYDVGDLWTNNTDLYVCQTARASGSYNAGDWKLATDYTTKTAVQALIKVATDSVTLRVESAEEKATAAQNTANNAVTAAGKAQTSADNANSAVATVKEDVSELKVKQGEISASVSSVTTIANEAKTASDNAVSAANKAQSTANSASSAAVNAQKTADGIEVGGRNLVVGSSKYRKDTPAVTSAAADAYTYLDDTSVYLESGKTYMLQACCDLPWSTGHGSGVGTGKGTIWIANKERSYHRVFVGDGVTVGRYTWNFTHTGTTGDFVIRVNGYGQVTKFWDIKIESGNKATDWTPPPEDVDREIDGVKQEVSTLKVTSKGVDMVSEDSSGKLVSFIGNRDTGGAWEAKYYQGGKAVSGLYFDFSTHRFNFDGDLHITSENISRPNYTNQIPKSTDTDGSVYGGTGFRAGYGPDDSYNIVQLSKYNGYATTGFIPCKVGDTIRLEGLSVNKSSSIAQFIFYNAQKAFLGSFVGAGTYALITEWGSTVDSSGNYTVIPVGSITLANGHTTIGAAFVRVVASGVTTASVVTINEVISDNTISGKIETKITGDGYWESTYTKGGAVASGLYFDLFAGQFKFAGAIVGGSININDNFLVDSMGNVALNGNVTWGTGTSPTQVVYAASALAKPANGTKWSTFPASGSGWHQSWLATDYYASYTYDSGNTWTDAIQVRGKNGADGSSASVSHESVFNALTNNGTVQGIFEQNGQIYFNASYIKSGTISTDLIDTDDLWAKKLYTTDGSNGYVNISNGQIAASSTRNAYTYYADLTGAYYRAQDPVSSKYFYAGFATGSAVAYVGWYSDPHVRFYSDYGMLSGTWKLNESIMTASDAGKKHEIVDLDERYSTLFDLIRPVAYKYNDGTSDRYHTGFIANEVEEALEKAGIDTQEFAGFVAIDEENEDGTTAKTRCLRYEEFIAVLWGKVKQLEKRLEVLQ